MDAHPLCAESVRRVGVLSGVLVDEGAEAVEVCRVSLTVCARPLKEARFFLHLPEA